MTDPRLEELMSSWMRNEERSADYQDALADAAEQLRALVHEDEEYRQVWTVAYDGDTPSMDGTHPPIRMTEMDRERAEMVLGVIRKRSARAPKRNLRIETRFVTEWEVDEDE